MSTTGTELEHGQGPEESGMWMDINRFAIYLISDLAKLAKVEFLEIVSSFARAAKFGCVVVVVMPTPADDQYRVDLSAFPKGSTVSGDDDDDEDEDEDDD
ncbi:hypothetical protein ACLKA6_019639 [Drosophila palustris]